MTPRSALRASFVAVLLASSLARASVVVYTDRAAFLAANGSALQQLGAPFATNANGAPLTAGGNPPGYYSPCLNLGGMCFENVYSYYNLLLQAAPTSAGTVFRTDLGPAVYTIGLDFGPMYNVHAGTIYTITIQTAAGVTYSFQQPVCAQETLERIGPPCVDSGYPYGAMTFWGVTSSDPIQSITIAANLGTYLSVWDFFSTKPTPAQVLVASLTALVNGLPATVTPAVKALLLGVIQQIPTAIASLTTAQKTALINGAVTLVQNLVSFNLLPAAQGTQFIALLKQF